MKRPYFNEVVHVYDATSLDPSQYPVQSGHF